MRSLQMTATQNMSATSTQNEARGRGVSAWVVIVDISLRTLELENEDSFEYLAEDGTPVRTPDSAHADHLFSVTSTQNGLQ